MLISEKRNFVFIAVPKTGTSSISKKLSEHEDIWRNEILLDGKVVEIANEHISASEMKAQLGEEWARYYTVGCARNPWSKVVSAYHFYRNGRAVEQVWQREKFTIKMLLNVVLAKLLPLSLWIRVHPLKTSAHFLTDRNGNLLVDRIIKFEDLADEFGKLCAEIGLEPGTIEHSNASSHRPYREYYSERNRRYVAKRFSEDIRLFGYSF